MKKNDIRKYETGSRLRPSECESQSEFLVNVAHEVFRGSGVNCAILYANYKIYMISYAGRDPSLW